MTLREGNLEAPTRHPIDWQSADFHDEGRAFAEMERVFDICHGCRRCVSLCQSFPTLFDLVDATADGEVHEVDKKDYAKVVDQCYLCDLCYMTKCPYVPPHPWNVDFPHLMLRAKAIRYGKGEVGAGAKLLASTDVHGQLAGIPIVVQAVNAANRDEAGEEGARRGARRPSRRLAAAAGDASASAARRPRRGRRPPSSTASAGRARSRCSRPATSTTTSRASAATSSRVLEHNEIPTRSSRRRAAAACPSSSSAISRASRGSRRRTSRCWPGTRARASRS